MATGFHLSTIGMSVRNVLAIAGPLTVPAIVAKLQDLYHSGVDEVEVRAALKELVNRKLVIKKQPGLFEASSTKIFQHRARPVFTDANRDTLAWEGWH